MNPFPTLYALAKNGKIREWNISVLENKITTLTGFMDGKKITHTKIISVGKHIGRANETTPAEQALLEAQSDWNHKKNRQGFQEEIPTGSEVPSILSPMLAQTYQKSKQKIVFPAAIQPKYDGIRAVANVQLGTKSIQLFSRTQRPFTIPIITDALLKLKKYPKESQIWLDGELYHPDIPFSTISGFLGRLQPDLTDPIYKMIQYWIYDLYIPSKPDLSFRERNEILQHLSSSSLIHIVPTQTIERPEQIDTELHKMVEAGYEGLMIRNWKSVYAVGQRSANLQKYKLFEDAEFNIVGYTEGTGIEKGLILWEVEIPKEVQASTAGQRFMARPRGTHTERAQLYQQAKQSFDTMFLGKKITIRFDGWTSKLIPRDPRAIAIRWDL